MAVNSLNSDASRKTNRSAMRRLRKRGAGRRSVRPAPIAPRIPAVGERVLAISWHGRFQLAERGVSPDRPTFVLSEPIRLQHQQDAYVSRNSRVSRQEWLKVAVGPIPLAD